MVDASGFVFTIVVFGGEGGGFCILFLFPCIIETYFLFYFYSSVCNVDYNSILK